MKIALYCHHTPYLALLSHIPDTEWYVLPTDHAPAGWREDQRPKPANVSVVDHIPVDAQIMLLQNAHDMAVWPNQRQSYRADPTLLFLGHNRFEYEGDPHLAGWLSASDVPLVCISDMKAKTWEEGGYIEPITVIPPGIPEQSELWLGTNGKVLTVVNNIRRPLFDLDGWLELTKDLPVSLVGEGNEGIPGAVGPAGSWDELKRWYRESAVYLNPTTGTSEDIYNLAMLEAGSFGCPATQTQRMAHIPLDEWQRVHIPLAKWLITDDARISGELERVWVRRKFPMDRFIQRWQQVLAEASA